MTLCGKNWENDNGKHMDRVKRIWYLSSMRAVSQEEPSDRKPDPRPLWMAGHAQLKFVMTECSKTQIRLTGLILMSWYFFLTFNGNHTIFHIWHLDTKLLRSVNMAYNGCVRTSPIGDRHWWPLVQIGTNGDLRPPTYWSIWYRSVPIIADGHQWPVAASASERTLYLSFIISWFQRCIVSKRIFFGTLFHILSVHVAFCWNFLCVSQESPYRCWP